MPKATPVKTLTDTAPNDGRAQPGSPIAENADAPTVKRPSRLSSRGASTALQVGVVLFALVCWQIASDTGLVDSFYVSTPIAVIERLWEFLTTGETYRHILVTTREAMWGYIAGSIVGVLVGFLLGSSMILGRTFLPLLNLLNTLPRVALAPLFILWFGIGELSKVVLVFSVVVVIMVFNTFAGTQTVDRDIATNARLLGANRLQLMRKITLPWCVPWIFSGLRISLAWSIGAAIIGEYLASREGLGNLIFKFSAGLDQTSLLAGCALLLLISGVLFAVLGVAERYLLRWRPETTLGG